MEPVFREKVYVYALQYIEPLSIHLIMQTFDHILNNIIYDVDTQPLFMRGNFLASTDRSIHIQCQPSDAPIVFQ